MSLLYLILFLVNSIVAQECLNARDLNLTTCTYVDYQIYSYQLNVSGNEAQASATISKVVGLSAFISKECVDQVKKYTCAYWYPACSIAPGGPTKRKPCIQMCEQLNVACASYLYVLSPTEMQFINCSQTDTDDGTPKFADGGDCYTLENHGDTSSGCQKYDKSLAPLTSSFCSPFISEEIFVPYLDPTAQSSLDVVANTTLWEISKLYPVLPIGCYQSLLSLLCQTSFPTCNRILDDDSGDIIELGASPCNEICQTAMQECRFFTEVLGFILFNCSEAKGMWPHGPTYPVQVNGNKTVDNFCSNSIFPPNASAQFIMPPVISCPSIFAKRPHPQPDQQPCWIPCPDPTYTKKMWHDLTTIGLTSAGISFVLMAFLLISTALSASRRGRRIHMCVFLASMLQSISFFINTTNPEDHVWCDDPVTQATSTNVACGAQAFMFQWFTLAISAWWFIVSFHMYHTVVKRQLLEEARQFEKFYYSFGWGLPLILTIITAALGSHGYGPPASWCYIHDPGFVDNYSLGFTNQAGISMDWWLFYIPVGCSLLGTLILMAKVFIYVFKTFREIEGIRATTKADLRVQARIFFFIVLLFINFVLVCEWRITLELLDKDQIKHDDFLFVYCQIKNDLGIEYSDSCLGDKLPYRVNYSHTAFETFLASSFGFWVFLAFGTDPVIFAWWKQLFKLRSKSELLVFIATETTQSSSTNDAQMLRTDTSGRGD